jgi:hypothetical protein
LKDTAVINPSGVTGDFTVYVAGGFAAFFRLPDAATYRQQPMMAVAYAGEDISCHQYRNDTGMMLNGYLMREQGARRSPGREEHYETLEDYLAAVRERGEELRPSSS